MNITHAQLYRTLSIILTGVLLTAMGLFTFLLFNRINQVSREGQTYTRYNSCVLSKPAHVRDEEVISKCWERVQSETGITVDRYDK